MGRLLIASLFLSLALATGAKANCYVLQNNTDREQKWLFSYDTSIGPNTLRNVTIAPHDHYPSEGQWCWDRVPWKAVVRVEPGYYRLSWKGAFTMGDGDGASPSGVYSLEPVDDAPPPSRQKTAKAPKAPKAAKAPKTQGAPEAPAAQGAPEVQQAQGAGAAPAISCVNDACDVLFQNGRVSYTDANRKSVGGVATLVGFKAPGSISCTAQPKPSGEICVVVDSTGQTWRGPMRPSAGAWTLWTKPPQN